MINVTSIAGAHLQSILKSAVTAISPSHCLNCGKLIHNISMILWFPPSDSASDSNVNQQSRLYRQPWGVHIVPKLAVIDPLLDPSNGHPAHQKSVELAKDSPVVVGRSHRLLLVSAKFSWSSNK